MKKHSIILFVLFHSAFIFSFGQSESSSKFKKAKWGEDLQFKSGENTEKFIFDNGKNIYLLNFKSAAFVLGHPNTTNVKPTIQKFDENFNPTKSVAYSETDDDVQYTDTYWMKNKIYLITSTLDKKEWKRSYFVQCYDDDLNPVGGKSKICTIDGPRYNQVNCRIDLSPDSGMIMFSLNPEVTKDKPNTISFKVFNHEMKGINEGEIKLSKPYKQINCLTSAVSSNGIATFLIKEYESEKAKEKVENASGKSVPGYKLFLLNRNIDHTEKMAAVDIGEKFLVNSKLITNISNNIQLFMTTTNEHKENIHALCFLETDFSCDILRKINYEITSTFADRVRNGEGGKNDKDHPAISVDYLVTDMLNGKDGSLFIILENKWEAYNEKSRTMDYFANGIVALKISGEAVVWCNYFPKKQFVGEFSGFIYHKAFIYNGELTILHNVTDGCKNIGLDGSVKNVFVVKAIDNVSLVQVVIDDKGKMTRTIVGDNNTFNTNIDLSLTNLYNGNRLILAGLTFHFMAKKTRKFGLVKFD